MLYLMRRQNKRAYGLIWLILVMLLFAGCTKIQMPWAESEAAETAELTQTPDTHSTPSAVAVKRAPQLIGFVVFDDGSDKACMSMHGFLHMSENLGYPAKLYRAKAGADAVSAVEKAVQDGCKGLLIQDENGVNDAAVKKAVDAGVRVIVAYDRCGVDGLTSNVVADDTEYVEEVTRGIASRMTERSLKSGRILLYGASPEAIAASFEAAAQADCPQYKTIVFKRQAATEEEAVEELAEFLLYNRDIKGMYVSDSAHASIAVQARAKAQSRFRAEGTPSPLPTLAPTPPPVGQTPEPTVAPGLLTQISITVFASGVSDENLALLNEGDIYALCIEPYYEVYAHATMALDQALAGESVAAESSVNRPIANADTIDKYLAIYRQSKEMFAAETTAAA